MRVILCVIAAWVVFFHSTLSADILFGDDFEQDDFDNKWKPFSNWKVQAKGGNRFAEKLDDAGQVDLEIKDLTVTEPFTVQLRLKQLNADAGAHVAIYTVNAPFKGYIYGFHNAGIVEFNDIDGKLGRVEFGWKVDADTWVTYKVTADAKGAKCYYLIEGEADFTLSHEIEDVGIEQTDVFIGLWVGSVVHVDDVYVWAGVDKSLEEALAVEPANKLAITWGKVKGR